MGFRFRKRVKLLPGIHLNVGKTGLSVSAKAGPVSITKGRGRTTSTIGIPGSGFSHTAVSRNASAVAGATSEAPPPDLISSMAGWILRGLAVVLGLSGVVSVISAAKTSTGAALFTGAVVGLLAWGLWRWGSSKLRR